MASWGRAMAFTRGFAQSSAIFFGTALGQALFSFLRGARSGGWVVRWERTVAVVSYALAQSKASARLAALFFTLLAQASVLQAASPLVPGCVRGSNSVRLYTLNEPADCSSELRALALQGGGS